MPWLSIKKLWVQPDDSDHVEGNVCGNRESRSPAAGFRPPAVSQLEDHDRADEQHDLGKCEPDRAHRKVGAEDRVALLRSMLVAPDERRDQVRNADAKDYDALGC